MVIDELSYFYGMSNQNVIGALLLKLMAKGDVTIVREEYKKKEREMRGRFLVTNVRTESFRFRSVPLEMSGVEPEKTKAERRAEKEAQKAARKAAKDGKSKKPHSMPKRDAPQQVMTIGEGKAS